jgi:hypothetical protein
VDVVTPVEERDLVAALRRLAKSTEVPPPDAQVERVLLEAFDATREAPRPAARRWFVRPVAAAALLALAATVAWVIVSRPGRGPAPARTAVAPLATTEFVVWPGAAELPRFESGHLMRVDLPVSALPSLGLVPPPSRSAVVQADVLVGQDGLPRAVRLSPDF